ncbi:MAG: DUF1653 domain-containing protein [Lachnospiraceae bacterium]|nr:DUF1653 domain-containing protein [Lachnospiraceae bacterium]
MSTTRVINKDVRIEMNTPKAQEVYRHFKGQQYRIVAVAEHTESGEQLVIYQALYGEGKIYARPLEMFCSPVDKEKYPEVTQQMRFEKVTDEANAQDENPDIDPQLDEFLMADSYEKRLEILVSLKSRITDDMLTTMSVACDITLADGSVEEKYETFKKALMMLDKFECTRLRG